MLYRNRVADFGDATLRLNANTQRFPSFGQLSFAAPPQKHFPMYRGFQQELMAESCMSVTAADCEADQCRLAVRRTGVVCTPSSSVSKQMSLPQIVVRQVTPVAPDRRIGELGDSTTYEAS